MCAKSVPALLDNSTIVTGVVADADGGDDSCDATCQLLVGIVFVVVAQVKT